MSLAFEQLQELIWSFRQSRVVLSAIELDVFSKIASGATAAEVGAKIGTDPRATEMLLNALVNLELLTKTDSKYFNAEVASRYLSGDARMSVMHQVGLWNRWSSLTQCVKTGTAVLPSERSESDTEAFIAAMHRNASERAVHVVESVEASRFRKMLDLGGGSGAYSIAFAQANPELHVTIFDRAEVLKIASRHVANAGLANRIGTHPGDMLVDSLPSGNDFILLSQILHAFGVDENRQLLKRAYAALNPGGQIAIQEFLLDPERTSPRWAVLFSLNMLVGTPSGSSYTEAEIRSWLEKAGFRNVRHVPLPPNTNLIVAEK
ncbi:MAG TPA: methyltransferase [Terriglobales bacterium]|nr:methyltransferase [Terriglobales bacterium]